MEIDLNYTNLKIIHIVILINYGLVVGIDSYLNTEQIEIGGIEIMISAYGSLGWFGYILISKYIGHNPYTGRRSNFH